MAELIKDWHIKNIPEDTRHKVTIYAAQKRISIAEAVTELVNKALTL